ncbi:MAG: DUF2723 domain-containing protein [Bacteroidales bacterium]|jgi:hypothetical protein|nr:DUF2723 domain-containing protein [Bacteroidales bacterium]
MGFKKFKKINNIMAVVVFAIAAFTYLSTIEPSASFWDCGEFIASSYKLEVGHPPGNPDFQLIARFFTFFGNKEHAAMLINSMSALCSALTILLLYLTIVHLARRIIEKKGGLEKAGNAIAAYAAGAVGALAYCWSDTFWFSAVEGEVYGMSSLFTAFIFWAMLKWEEDADGRYANRWIVLIAFLMGISIGVHLLNLLTIPAMGMIYYYRKYKFSKKGAVNAFLLSCVILAFILFLFIPYLPKSAAYVDLFFVNILHFSKNIGAAIYILALIALCFWGIYYSYKKRRKIMNIVLLCLTMLMMGYSVFAVVIIRSSVNTPTNEYQPDNPFTLVRYIDREQYGSAPIIYGQTYASKIVDLKTPSYWNFSNGKYIKLDGPVNPVYDSSTETLFPRMWSDSDDSYKSFYAMYTNGKGRAISGSNEKMPTFGAELSYFLDYQLDFMYLRYFMWNFVGRQNDLQPSIPGDLFKGNWESGIKFIDKARLGDQSTGPDYIVHSRAKNHFYFLPLLLGLLGLFYQYKKDGRNFFVIFLLFFLTGIAIVMYLNQPPLQPRERDYAYAGSFYAFAIWIGLGVMVLYDLFKKIMSPRVASVLAGVLCICVPFQMLSQTWDDHDRSGRYMVRNMAYNYLKPLGKDAMLVTHGDNDTFPLWYIQEVEGVRTDVRILNTSLLGTDWYIDQMKCKSYDSDPVPIDLDRSQYFYGTNDYVQVYNRFGDRAITAKAVMDIFKNPKIVVPLSDGRNHNYIAADKISIPVNKANVRKYQIVPDSLMSEVPDTIVLKIPDGVKSINKTDLIILDILSNYNWDRPFYFLQRGGDINIGIKDYLMYDGFTYKFVPIKNATGTAPDNVKLMDPKVPYNLMHVYNWQCFNDSTLNFDYQHVLTFNSLVPIRSMFATAAGYVLNEGRKEEAISLLDKMQEVTSPGALPLNNSVISAINDRSVMNAIKIYLQAGARDKAFKLCDDFVRETRLHLDLFSKIKDGRLMSEEYFQQSFYYLLLLEDTFKNNGASDKAKELSAITDGYIKQLKVLGAS